MSKLLKLLIAVTLALFGVAALAQVSKFSPVDGGPTVIPPSGGGGGTASDGGGGTAGGPSATPPSDSGGGGPVDTGGATSGGTDSGPAVNSPIDTGNGTATKSNGGVSSGGNKTNSVGGETSKSGSGVPTPAGTTTPVVAALYNFADKLASKILALTPSEVKTAADTGRSIGLVAVAGELLSGLVPASNLSDLYLELLRLLGVLTGIVGLRRRAPWGTVYDSVTKRPLDPAIVTALQNSKEMQDAITDLDGRYAFFLPAGEYTLNIQKSNYTFPSKRMAGKNSDLFYNNLYFGGAVSAKGGELITRDVPMDPEGFDWNEFEKNKERLFHGFLRREKLRTLIFRIIFLIGLVSALTSAYLSPSKYNYALLCALLAVYGLQKLRAARHHSSMLTQSDGKPLSFAIAHLYQAGTNTEAKRVVADEMGRFFMLVAPGNYYLIVDVRQAAGWYHSIRQTRPMRLPRGVLPRKVVVHGGDITLG